MIKSSSLAEAKVVVAIASRSHHLVVAKAKKIEVLMAKTTLLNKAVVGTALEKEVVVD